jgi:hypothetical protein
VESREAPDPTPGQDTIQVSGCPLSKVMNHVQACHCSLFPQGLRGERGERGPPGEKVFIISTGQLVPLPWKREREG